MKKRMLYWMFAVACMVTGWSTSAVAADKVRGNIGIGVGQGTTVGLGLSGKLYMGDSVAIQPVLGISDNRIGLSVDALLEMPALFNSGPIEIAWALGLGPGVAVGSDNFALGIAGVAGLEFNFSVIPSLPFDLVVEYRPSFFIIPVDLNLVSFSGHLRVYF